jgi:hypothetical protein
VENEGILMNMAQYVYRVHSREQDDAIGPRDWRCCNLAFDEAILELPYFTKPGHELFHLVSD